MADGPAACLGHLPVPDEAEDGDAVARLEAFLKAARRPRARQAARLLLKQASLAELFSGYTPLARAVAGEDVAWLIGAARDVMMASMSSQLLGRPFIGNRDQAVEFLQLMTGFSPVEQLIVIYLDACRRIIAYRKVAEGSPRGADLPTRTLLMSALERGAAGIILVHNHPSGNPEPSNSDYRATRRLADACRALEIDLVDHIIVARGSSRSIAW